MIQRIEHLHAELQFPLLIDRESLNYPEVQVPVTRRGKDVAARTILSRWWYAETHVRVCPASVGLAGRRIDIDRLEQHRPRQRRTLQILELSLSEDRHAGASLMAAVRRERAAAHGKRF